MNLFGSDMILFGSDLIFLCSKFQFHKPSVLLVDVLINDVKKQVPQASFKTVDGDLISFQTFGSDMKLFGSHMILFRSYLLLFCSKFKIQELSVMVVAALTNFGVKNQVPQFFLKIVAGDLVLVFSYEVSDILFCESLDISEAISDYGAQ